MLKNQSFAQIKHYDFNLIVNGDLGQGTFVNETTPDYNINSFSSELLLKYRITYNLGIATGVGLTEYNGDGVNFVGTFHHERSIVKVPLAVVLDYPVSEKVSIVPKFGVYGHYIVKDQHQFLKYKINHLYSGWNFGAEMGLGILYQISKNALLGFQYRLMYDLTQFETIENNAFIYTKQKAGRVNNLGLQMIIEL